jgi:hypothetical protein
VHINKNTGLGSIIAQFYLRQKSWSDLHLQPWLFCRYLSGLEIHLLQFIAMEPLEVIKYKHTNGTEITCQLHLIYQNMKSLGKIYDFMAICPLREPAWATWSLAIISFLMSQPCWYNSWERRNNCNPGMLWCELEIRYWHF